MFTFIYRWEIKKKLLSSSFGVFTRRAKRNDDDKFEWNFLQCNVIHGVEVTWKNLLYSFHERWNIKSIFFLFLFRFYASDFQNILPSIARIQNKEINLLFTWRILRKSSKREIRIRIVLNVPHLSVLLRTEKRKPFCVSNLVNCSLAT